MSETTAETTSEVMTPLDVENKFRIPRSSQKKGRAKGSFAPYFRVGRRVYYRRVAFLEWIAQQEQQQVGAHRAHLESLFPNLGEQAHEVARELVYRAPALSREQLDSVASGIRCKSGGCRFWIRWVMLRRGANGFGGAARGVRGVLGP